MPTKASKSEHKILLGVRPNSKVRFEILHEDADVIVINKPAGLVTQPGKGHSADSLLNGLFALHGKLLHNLGTRRDFGLLHRLDKDTSGLLVVAKTPSAYDQLRRDFEARLIDKEYIAIVRGIPNPRKGVIQARLKESQAPGPDGEFIKKVVISKQGQEAVSAYDVTSAVESPVPCAVVRVDIKTGRLHQIRAHMMFQGATVCGDLLYTLPGIDPRDPSMPRAPRLCLHAARLGFKQPTGKNAGKWVHYEAPLPQDLAAFAAKLGLKT